jgi:hypothetical protein
LSAEGTVLEGLSVNSHLLQSDPQFHRRKQSMVGSPRYQMDPEWTIPREKLCILKVIDRTPYNVVIPLLPKYVLIIFLYSDILTDNGVN